MSTGSRGCRYDEDFKRTLVNIYQNGGKTQTELCSEYGVSLTSLARWIKQYSTVTTDDGEILNCEELCNIYHDLNKKYYGDDVVSDDEIALEWARIPHFYTSFYVYQYATAYSAATTIADKILTEGESAVNDYKKFLKSGCSDYPIEVLKYAGVDMSKPQPIEQAMEVFKKMLDEMKKVVDKK